MKRSPLKRKPVVLKRVKLKSRTSPRTSKHLFDDHVSESKGLYQKKESKVDEWNRVKSELKEQFVKAGITSCELRWSRCTLARNFGFTWSFAHSLKRDKISADPEIRPVEIREVIYACGECHDQLEKIGNKERFDGKPKMMDIVRDVISRRVRQP